MPKTDDELLEMALLGYKAERDKLLAKIVQIHAQVDNFSEAASRPK
jgi:hypothetical protein